MKKKMLLAAITMAMVLMVTGCGTDGGNNKADSTQEVITSEDVSDENNDKSDETIEKEESGDSQQADGSQSTDSETGSNYGIATTATDDAVEKFASDVKNTVLAGDWDTLGDMVRYPITVGDNEIADKESFVTALENEDCTGLMANGQGICMGSGEVWFLDVNFDGIEQKGEPDFKIITFNGII